MRTTEERMAALEAYPDRAPFRGLVLMVAGLVGILAGAATGHSWAVWLGGLAYLAGQVWQSVSFHRWRRGYLAAMAGAATALREDMEERFPLLPDGDGS